MLSSILGGLKDQIPSGLLEQVGLDSSKSEEVAEIAGDIVDVFSGGKIKAELENDIKN